MLLDFLDEAAELVVVEDVGDGVADLLHDAALALQHAAVAQAPLVTRRRLPSGQCHSRLARCRWRLIHRRRPSLVWRQAASRRRPGHPPARPFLRSSRGDRKKAASRRWLVNRPSVPVGGSSRFLLRQGSVALVAGWRTELPAGAPVPMRTMLSQAARAWRPKFPGGFSGAKHPVNAYFAYCVNNNAFYVNESKIGRNRALCLFRSHISP
jgi:hypothetical protein